MIHADTYSSNLYNPGGLVYLGSEDISEGFEVKRTGGILDRVRTPTSFMIIENDLATSYEIAIYRLQDVNQSTDTPVGGATALRRTKIYKPSDDQLRIDELTGGKGLCRLYKYTAGTPYVWELLEGSSSELTNATARRRIHLEIDEYTGGRTERKRIYGYDNASGLGNQLVSDVTTTYDEHAWGEVVTEIKVENGANDLVTEKAYYTSGPEQGRLKYVKYPDGNWSFYDYDDQGRVENLYTPFEDKAFTTSPNKIGTRCVTYTYPSGTITYTTIVTWVNNYIVRKQFSETTQTSTQVTSTTKLAQYSTSSWGSSTNLITTTVRDKSTNRVTSVTRPDGTKSEYTYSVGSYSDWSHSGENYSGHPTFKVTGKHGVISGGTLTEGIEAITETSQSGEILYEKRSGVHPTGGTRVFYEASASTVDDFKRVTRTYHNSSGRYTYRLYDCCNLSWAIDEQGMATNYQTDVLSRISREDRGVWNGSTSSPSMSVLVERHDYDLDGLGRTRKTTRNRVVSDGTPSTITVETNLYNLAGHLTEQSDALGKTTYYYENISTSGRNVITVSPKTGNGYPTTRTYYYRDGSLEEQQEYGATTTSGTGVVSGSWVRRQKFDYAATTGYLDTTVTNAGSGSTTTRWTKTRRNMIGEIAYIYRPRGNGSGSTVTETFNYASSGSGKGKLYRHIDPDGVTTRYAYNNLGELWREARDRNTGSNSSLNLYDDIVREYERYWTLRGSDIVHHSATWLYSKPNDDSTKKLIEKTERHRNGRKTWSTRYAQETLSEQVISSNGNWTVTSTLPDGSQQIATTTSGKLASEIHRKNSSNVISKKSYTYDGHNRLKTVADLQFGTTTLTYTNRDQLYTEARPDPDGSGTATYTHSYDNYGNRTSSSLPGGGTASYTYYANGKLKSQSGEGLNTADFIYDTYGGRLTQMKTRYGNTSTVNNTYWTYDTYRNWLSAKDDHNSNGATYQHTAAGRLSSRTWQRGDDTDYSYNDAGQLELVDYTDFTHAANTTPDIQYSYHRTGTLAWAKDGASSGGVIGTPRYTYNYHYEAAHPLVLDFETIVGVHTQTKYLRRKHDSLLRNTGYYLGTSIDWDNDMEVTYSYRSSDGRINTVLSESFESYSDTFTYGYVYGSGGQYSPDSVTGPKKYSRTVYQGNTYLLDYIENRTSSGASIISKYDYRYDRKGRRDRKDLSGDAFASTTYDTYAYNSQWGLTEGKRHTSGGSPVSGKDFDYTYDNIGNRLTANHGGTGGSGSTTYTPSALNQYSAVSGVGGGTVSYDSDGNLTDLGSKDFLYNAENRLIEVKNGSTSLAKFKYDHLGRRVEKETSSKTETYAYDGWNLIAVYDDSAYNHTPLITYTWGWDLSDSLQGAGGVGGLLMSCERGGTGWSYYHDGHGNVSQIVSQSTGSVNTKVEYDPYGNIIAGTPTWSLVNAFRFSSKFYDSETGLLYYGFRYYDPVHGRWMTQDPIEEAGGLNLYGFVRNNITNTTDLLGMGENDAGANNTPQTPNFRSDQPFDGKHPTLKKCSLSVCLF